jgi:hypothetical protein
VEVCDTLRIAVWAGVVATAVAGACLVYVLSENSGSRNIALATGALLGALALLAVQLRFELRSEPSTDFITAEYTIDRAKPEIRQWKYDNDQGHRLGREVGASQIFAGAHPGQFDGDREKLTHDMVIFSLLAYFGVEQFDWQMKRVQFIGQMATLTRTSFGSRPDECTTVTKAQLQKLLSDAGNFFADANMFFGGQTLCLPSLSLMRRARSYAGSNSKMPVVPPRGRPLVAYYSANPAYLIHFSLTITQGSPASARR